MPPEIPADRRTRIIQESRPCMPTMAFKEADSRICPHSAYKAEYQMKTSFIEIQWSSPVQSSPRCGPICLVYSLEKVVSSVYVRTYIHSKGVTFLFCNPYFTASWIGLDWGFSISRSTRMHVRSIRTGREGMLLPWCTYVPSAFGVLLRLAINR